MFFYNLFIFFTVCDANYLYYVFYILSVGFTQVTLLGYTYKYLWPDFPRFANQSLILFAAFAGISIVLFLRKFLQVKKYAPLLNKGLNIIFIGYAIAVALRLFADHNIIYNNISYNLADILAGIIGFYSLIIAIIISLKGYRPAKFFLLAWSIFLIGMFIYVLRNFGFLPYNNFTTYLMPFGNAAEVILLSFALADRINVLKKEKEISQAEALKAFEENERIIKEQNVMLENKVKERTEDLTKTNEELAKALKELKEAQSQLVQSEKMASLGQLTAGIAHEINNPINFVNTSIRPLRRDINDILSVLKEYDNLSKENFKERIQEISSLKNSIDLPYLKKEIESLLQGIEEGATRTAEIVKGLRTFSRIDETDLKRVDIHEGIDSTLILLASMMHGKIVIEKNYGSLPLVECYAGKMNQVFMNILNNAIHAILKKNMKDEEGKIIIKTSEFRNDVVISIKDNGIGMSEEVRKKIFDPFFTTKDVGEGTGLGLSIVYKIIENHKGKIEVHSEEGLGTAFTLTLPKLYSES
jgi:signal transduction histidine kinase